MKSLAFLPVVIALVTPAAALEAETVVSEHWRALSRGPSLDSRAS